MKCQQCEKAATFHITELTGGKPQELHLCEDHARQYLTSSASEPANVGSMAAALAQQMAQQMAIGQTAEELAQVDQQACPVCGMTWWTGPFHPRPRSEAWVAGTVLSSARLWTIAATSSSRITA